MTGVSMTEGIRNIGGDTSSLKLGSGTLAEGDYPGLCDVERHLTRGEIDCSTTADEDDSPPACLPQIWDGGPDRVERRAEVEIHHPLKTDVIGVFDITSSGPPSDEGTETMNRTPVVSDVFEERDHSFGVGCVNSGSGGVGPRRCRIPSQTAVPHPASGR